MSSSAAYQTPSSKSGHQSTASSGKPVPQLPSLASPDSLYTESFVRKFTPRSVEACKLLGVLPDELAVRSYEHFYQHNIPANIQKLRYQDYEQMRQETIGMVREERDTLIAAGWNEAVSPAAKLKIQAATLKAMMLPSDTPTKNRSANSSPVRGTSARENGSHSSSGSPERPTRHLNIGAQVQAALSKSMTMPSLHSKHENQSSSTQSSALLPQLLPEEHLIEMEQDRIKKIMIRQNKEIESMMAYELKVAQMVAKQEQKMEMRRQKEALLAEQRKEERYKQAEKRRLWELQKHEEESKAKAAQQLAMQRLNEQERKHYEEQLAKDEERRRDAQRKTMERRKKKMELEMRAQQNLERQFEMMRERERDMAERDRRRREALEEKKRKMAEEHQGEKMKAMQRMQNVMQTNQKVLEEKREDMNKKMSDMEIRLQRFDELKRDIMREKQEEIRAREARRQAALNDSKHQLEERVHTILDKKQKHDQLKDELEAKAQEQHVLKMELRRLNKIRKQANVERLRRMQEYHRDSLNEKLSDEAKRLKELEEQKHHLMAKRQQNAIQMFRQKEQVIKMFAELQHKKKWDQIHKLGGKANSDDEERDDKHSSNATPSHHSSNSPNKPSHSASKSFDAHSQSPAKNPNTPINLLDALQGLNKLVNKSQKKSNTPQKKGHSIDDFLKHKNQQNQLNKSKSNANF